MNKKDIYYVAIEETRVRVIEVLASSESEAVKKTSHIYNAHKNFIGNNQYIHKHTFRPYKKCKTNLK